MSSTNPEKKLNVHPGDESMVLCQNLPGVSSFLVDNSGGENKTVRDIALTLKITDHRVIDALKRLDETGLIQLKRNKIVIKDIDSLKDISMVSS